VSTSPAHHTSPTELRKRAWRSLTGADPADPAHRYKLQTAVIGARLLDWPAQDL
jgi:hypothetical protein